MGLFADLSILKNIRIIKQGGTAKFSISQITNVLINLPDAKMYLSPCEFNQVLNLFKQLRTCNTKMVLDYEGYLQQAVDIIKRFDKIAPYEKYCGGNEIEFSFLMEDIRSNINNTDNNTVFDDDAHKYAELLVQNSKSTIDIEDSTRFVSILLNYSIHDKAGTIKSFDKFTGYIVNKYGPIQSSMIINYFISILNTNDVISKPEADQMYLAFTSHILQDIFPDK